MNFDKQMLRSILEGGWVRVARDSEPDLLLEILSAREECLQAFLKFMHDAASMPDVDLHEGQSGFVRDGDEGSVGLRELRSHLMVNQPLPSQHPLTTLAPYFYGPPQDELQQRWPLLSAKTQRLSRALDELTAHLLECLECELSLPFGTLAAPVAMGERLVRFQWYPPAQAGSSTEFSVEVAGDRIPVVGWVTDAGGELEARWVRASPHRDTGFWTWQVYTSDAALRFWDPERKRPFDATPGPWIYGNACELMSLAHPAFVAPLHWVDTDETTGSVGRLSISYFVHTRPSALAGALPSGVALYARLAELGYATASDVDTVREFLADRETLDSDLVKRCIAWEAEQGNRPPAGFAVGVSRYYLSSAPSAHSVVRPGPNEAASALDGMVSGPDVSLGGRALTNDRLMDTSNRVGRPIVISGDLGSGKTTVSAALARALRALRVSTGDFQRQLAEQLGMSTLELNQHAEVNKEIDELIDARHRALAGKEDRVVLDARLGWHFLPEAFKVHLLVDPIVGAGRVITHGERTGERYHSLHHAMQDIGDRAASERRRFSEQYGVDIRRLRNYDLVVDTTSAPVQLVVASVLKAWEGSPGPGAAPSDVQLLLCPTRVLPTQSVQTLAHATARDVEASVESGGFQHAHPIRVGVSDGWFFVVDGHRRLAASLRLHLPLIPAALVAEGAEFVVGDITADDYFRDAISLPSLYDWEEANGFRYTEYPPNARATFVRGTPQRM